MAFDRSPQSRPAVPHAPPSKVVFRTGSPGFPPRFCFYGKAGIGKTSMAAATDSPVFILSPGETGLYTLMDAGVVPQTIPSTEVHSWPALLAAVEQEALAPQGKTLVLDTISGMEDLANSYVTKERYENDPAKFMSYQNGFGVVAMGEWKRLLIALDGVRAKGVMVVLTAHLKTASAKNPAGQDWNKWFPSFAGLATWVQTFGWLDVCCFLDYDITTARLTGEKVKARGGERRLMKTQCDAAYDAKSRFPVPEEIEMGTSGAEAWGNLQAAIQAAKDGAK